MLLGHILKTKTTIIKKILFRKSMMDFSNHLDTIMAKANETYSPYPGLKAGVNC